MSEERLVGTLPQERLTGDAAKKYSVIQLVAVESIRVVAYDKDGNRTSVSREAIKNTLGYDLVQQLKAGEYGEFKYANQIISELQVAYDGLRARVDQLEREKQEAQENLKNLNSKYESLNKRNNALQEKNKTLQTRLEGIEDQLKVLTSEPVATEQSDTPVIATSSDASSSVPGNRVTTERTRVDVSDDESTKVEPVTIGERTVVTDGEPEVVGSTADPSSSDAEVAEVETRTTATTTEPEDRVAAATTETTTAAPIEGRSGRVLDRNATRRYVNIDGNDLALHLESTDPPTLRERLAFWRRPQTYWVDDSENRYFIADEDEEIRNSRIGNAIAIGVALVALVVAAKACDNSRDNKGVSESRVTQIERGLQVHINNDNDRDQADVARDQSNAAADAKQQLQINHLQAKTNRLKVKLAKVIAAERAEGEFSGNGAGHGRLGQEFNVEYGNGLTNEIQDFARKHGYVVPSGAQAYMIYINAEERFGTHLINSIGKSPDTYFGPHGDVRISNHGPAVWPHDVEEFLRHRLTPVR